MKNILLILLLILIAGLPAGYFYYRFQKAENQIKSTSAQKNSIETTLEKVGRLIELPKDETPTVAVVSDKNKLQDQVFFANAKNGDQVLIYTKAKRAILYRSSTNKIINVAPINLKDSSTATASPTLLPINK